MLDQFGTNEVRQMKLSEDDKLDVLNRIHLILLSSDDEVRTLTYMITTAQTYHITIPVLLATREANSLLSFRCSLQ
jgi:hypothetical protein